MSTQTEEDLSVESLLGRPVHTLCCEDHDRALCNTDVSGRPYKPAGTPITCVTCIENRFSEFCGKYQRHCEHLEYHDEDDE